MLSASGILLQIEKGLSSSQRPWDLRQSSLQLEHAAQIRRHGSSGPQYDYIL